MRNIEKISCLIVFLALSFCPSATQANIKTYDIFDSFENILRSCDMIVLGTVSNTSVEEEYYTYKLTFKRN